MEFLSGLAPEFTALFSSHWHCIVPAALIIAAVVLQNWKRKKGGNDE
jgi:ribose/xylose/arabinose/galactoside ABC-type transport system permease subunit